LAKLRSEAPGFDWHAWAVPQHIGDLKEWIIAQPSFFKAFAALVPRTPLATWKAWMAAQLITQNAPLLSRAFADAHFALFGTTLTGQQVQRDRWKRGVQLINTTVGQPVGRLYVEKHFSAA